MGFQNHKSSKGITILGFVLVMVVVLIFSLFGMKVIPMYMEFNGVRQALESMKAESFASPADARQNLSRRLSINYVDSVDIREDVSIRRQDGGYEIHVEYYVDKPLIGNLIITGHFTYTIVTGPSKE